MKNIAHFLGCSLAVLAMVFAGSSCRKDDTTPDSQEEKIEYTITSSKTISDFDSFIKSKSSGADMYYAIAMAIPSVKTLVNSKFTVKDKPIRVIRYNYTSIDPQGKEVTLSAIMAAPEQAFSGTSTNGIILYNHGSYTCDAQCGTNKDIFELMMTWMNYVFVAADYYGFGVSAEYPQAYLNPTVAARGSIDAYKAALQIMKDQNITYGSKVYNAGYSQGGFNSICNEKYLAENPDENITFTKTFAGGGSYDVPGTYDEFLKAKYPAGTIFCVSSIVAMNETEHLGIPYSSLLKGKVLENYQEWFLSKKYTNSQITTLMGSTDITDHLTDDVLAKTGSAFTAFWNCASKFSLVTGSWAPKKGSNVNLYHLDVDDCVPYANMTALKNHFAGVSTTGASISYHDLQDVELPADMKAVITTLPKYYSIPQHVCGAIIFVYDIIDEEF